MLKLFKPFLLALALAAPLSAVYAQAVDTANSVTVPVSGSGYAVNHNYYRVYFLTKQNGALQVALKARDQDGAKISCRLDAQGKTTVIKVQPSTAYSLVPVSTYAITKPGYHFIEIKQNEGNKLPDVSAAVLSGTAAQDVKFNNSQYKGAPATHLTYKVPGDSVAAWFYSEVSVPKIADTSVNAYYETNGFSGGYMGIQ
ncbi:DUF5077 domain-containing protein, partial [Mucilaginibacter sp.]|uniref:DUF5077 domain-containing protein n=1 Tax=Mucilaginibacter sp. TaxID=1882438 RepID=UPI002ED3D6C4